jgi:hypothetical protein
VTIKVAAELPPPPKADDDRRVRDVLDAYVGAIQHKDQTLAKHLRPGLTDKEFNNLTAVFRDADSIQISLDNCKSDLILDGAEAHVTCHQVTRVILRGSPQTRTDTAVYTVRKLKAGDWIIDKVAMR